MTGELTDIIRQLYGSVPRVSRLVSNNNIVCRLDFDRLPPKVIKLAGSGEKAPASIRREQQALRALARQGIDVPAIEFTQDDLPNAPRPFTVMPLLPGTTLEEACKSANRPWADEGCRWAGGFVHRMAVVPVEGFGFAERPDDDRSFLAYVRRNFEAEKMLVRPFSTILDEVDRLSDLPVRQLIHGDYAWNQIVTDGVRYAVIDWESVGVGHPLNMLGRAVAMVREYGGAQRHIDLMIEGYERERALSGAERRDLHLWEMWHHVGCMGWKFVCGADHRAHAFAMAERVKAWAAV